MNLVVSEVPALTVLALAFAFGACWGSFFNVAIYRWPRGLSVIKPPSHCPGCRARIAPHHNVPILGYLLLRGKTACCHQPLSPRYPIVETLGAVLAVAVAQRFILAAAPDAPLLDATLRAVCEYAFVGGLLVATFVDLEHMEIPDEVSLPGAALGLLTAVYRDPPGVESAAIGAGGGFLVIQVLFVWVYEALFGRRGMGEGDSKFLLMIGAFLGWQGALFTLFAAAAQGLVVALVALLTGRKLAPPPRALDSGAPTEPGQDGETAEDDALSDPPPAWVGHLKLPFGPFLALAALEYLFFGDRVLSLASQWLGR